MKLRIFIALLMTFAITPAFADKPQWAGKGKPGRETGPAFEHREPQRPMMKGRSHEEDYGEYEGEEDEHGWQSMEHRSDKSIKEDKPKGLARQTEKKAEQEQKELERGSEKGREARQVRKKWWKFWD